MLAKKIKITSGNASDIPKKSSVYKEQEWEHWKAVTPCLQVLQKWLTITLFRRSPVIWPGSSTSLRKTQKVFSFVAPSQIWQKMFKTWSLPVCPLRGVLDINSWTQIRGQHLVGQLSTVLSSCGKLSRRVAGYYYHLIKSWKVKLQIN